LLLLLLLLLVLLLRTSMSCVIMIGLGGMVRVPLCTSCGCAAAAAAAAAPCVTSAISCAPAGGGCNRGMQNNPPSRFDVDVRCWQWLHVMLRSIAVKVLTAQQHMLFVQVTAAKMALLCGNGQLTWLMLRFATLLELQNNSTFGLIYCAATLFRICPRVLLLGSSTTEVV
jgi:hypothetical protein